MLRKILGFLLVMLALPLLAVGGFLLYLTGGRPTADVYLRDSYFVMVQPRVVLSLVAGVVMLIAGGWLTRTPRVRRASRS